MGTFFWKNKKNVKSCFPTENALKWVQKTSTQISLGSQDIWRPGLCQMSCVEPFCAFTLFDIINEIPLYLNGLLMDLDISITFQHLSHSPIHTHSYSEGRGCHERCQLLIGGNFRFSIFLKDTLTCSWRSNQRPCTYWMSSTSWTTSFV